MLKTRGWSQRDLAILADIDEGTLSSYTTGRTANMPLAVAVAVADALGVHPRELYEWKP
ncbi:helix-turn-helix domain-containing protein [Cohnella silvisoli]|uniref:helix-turn-helix domain-containing protein n=1 Tax=Cohnella silvisoli TaxID=2873699 RepID=UPI0035A0C16A|nr:helix-turn-helix transcriptional regulator [Cohnella silvisoli]